MALEELRADHRLDNSLKAAKPKPAQSHFRVHLADGSKHDVLAESSGDAQRHIRKRYPDIMIIKTKLIRGEVQQ